MISTELGGDKASASPNWWSSLGWNLEFMFRWKVLQVHRISFSPEFYSVGYPACGPGSFAIWIKLRLALYLCTLGYIVRANRDETNNRLGDIRVLVDEECKKKHSIVILILKNLVKTGHRVWKKTNIEQSRIWAWSQRAMQGYCGLRLFFKHIIILTVPYAVQCST